MKWLLLIATTVIIWNSATYGEETTTYLTYTEDDNVGNDNVVSDKKDAESEISSVTTIEGYLTTNHPKSDRSLDINGINDSVKLVGSGTENKRSKIVIKKGENGEDFEYEYIYYYYDNNDENITKVTNDEENFKKTVLENSRGKSRTTATLKPDSSRNEIHYNGRHRKTTTLGVTREITTGSTESVFQSNLRSRQRPTTAANKDIGNSQETRSPMLRKPAQDVAVDEQFVKLKTLADKKEVNGNKFIDDFEKTTENFGKGQTKYLPINTDSDLTNKIDKNEDTMMKMALDLYAIAQNLSNNKVIDNEIHFESTVENEPSNETSGYSDSTTLLPSTITSPTTTTVIPTTITTTTTTTTTTEVPLQSTAQNHEISNSIGNKIRLKSRYGGYRYKPHKVVSSSEGPNLENSSETKSKYGRNRNKVAIELASESTSPSNKPRYGFRGRPSYLSSTQSAPQPSVSHSSDNEPTNSEPKPFSRPKLLGGQRRRNYLGALSTTTTTTTTMSTNTSVETEENDKKLELDLIKESAISNDNGLGSNTTQRTSKTRLHSNSLLRPFKGRQNLYFRSPKPVTNSDSHSSGTINNSTSKDIRIFKKLIKLIKKKNLEGSVDKMKLRNGSSNIQKPRNSSVQSTPITPRKINPLLARRKLKLISSTTSTTTLAPESDDSLQQTELPSLDHSDNENSDPTSTLATTTTTTITTTTAEPRGLNKLLSNRRRILNKNIGQ